MKQTLKDTNCCIELFLREELKNLNQEIITAAEAGDVIRRDVEEATIETLQNLCIYLSRAGLNAHIVAEEVEVIGHPMSGIGSVKQYSFVYTHEWMNCRAFDDTVLEVKKGA